MESVFSVSADMVVDGDAGAVGAREAGEDGWEKLDKVREVSMELQVLSDGKWETGETEEEAQ